MFMENLDQIWRTFDFTLVLLIKKNMESHIQKKKIEISTQITFLPFALQLGNFLFFWGIVDKFEIPHHNYKLKKKKMAKSGNDARCSDLEEIYEDIRKLKEFILKNSGDFNEVNRSKLHQNKICCFLFIVLWWVAIVSFILGIIFFNHCISNTNSAFYRFFVNTCFTNKNGTPNYLKFPKKQKKYVGPALYGNANAQNDALVKHKIQSRQRFEKEYNLCRKEGKARDIYERSFTKKRYNMEILKKNLDHFGDKCSTNNF